MFFSAFKSDLRSIRKILIADRYYGSKSARVSHVAENVYAALQDTLEALGMQCSNLGVDRYRIIKRLIH